MSDGCAAHTSANASAGASADASVSTGVSVSVSMSANAGASVDAGATANRGANGGANASVNVEEHDYRNERDVDDDKGHGSVGQIWTYPFCTRERGSGTGTELLYAKEQDLCQQGLVIERWWKKRVRE